MGPVAEMIKSTTATVIFTIFLVVSPVFSAPEMKPAEDRFFCMATAEQTCANACAGLDCSQSCYVFCGFWYIIKGQCSAVAAATCVTTAAPTTPTTTTATTTKTLWCGWEQWAIGEWMKTT